MSDLGLRIADLKTRRQESGDRSYEAEFRGQTTEDKKEQNLALQIFDFEIRNSQFEILPYAPCSVPSQVYNL